MSRRAVAPNPRSPFADADPAYRHIYPQLSLFPDPEPGVLALMACDGVAVIPTEPLEDINPESLPDGLCPACLEAVRAGRPAHRSDGDTVSRTPCRQCESLTSRDGLCVLCRQEAHDQWWSANHDSVPGPAAPAQRDA